MPEKDTDNNHVYSDSDPRDRPLAGVRIANTRPEHQASAFTERLEQLGASVVTVPLIRIDPPEDYGPLDAALAAIDEFDWVVFSSANGAMSFLDRSLAVLGIEQPLTIQRVAAVGVATQRALAARGVRVDVVPRQYIAESLAEVLTASAPLRGRRILIARAAVARDVLPDALRAAGARVDVVEAYQTAPDPTAAPTLSEAIDVKAIDIVALASASAVRSFVEAVGFDRARAVQLACIGPVTSETVRAMGLTVAIEAGESTAAGLADAIANAHTRRNRGDR